MRASFLKDLIVQDSYQIRGDSAHHLISVVRVELEEEILLLNGNGLAVRTRVQELAKRELKLAKIDSRQMDRTYNLDLALGIPKKEALELSLKQAVELGFRKIYLVRSQYSQTKLPEPERLESLLVSALEQSNSAFLPELIPVDWKSIPVQDYGQIIMLDSQTRNEASKLSKVNSHLLVVGPEGGFSPEEITALHNWPKVQVINLPTPILRTPTAVATGAGIVLGSLLD